MRLNHRLPRYYFKISYITIKQVEKTEGPSRVEHFKISYITIKLPELSVLFPHPPSFQNILYYY